MGNNGNSSTDHWRNEFIASRKHSLLLTHHNTTTTSWHDSNDNWRSISCDLRNIAPAQKKLPFSTRKKAYAGSPNSSEKRMHAKKCKKPPNQSYTSNSHEQQTHPKSKSALVLNHYETSRTQADTANHQEPTHHYNHRKSNQEE